MTIEPVNEALRGPVAAPAGPVLPEKVAARIDGAMQRPGGEHPPRLHLGSGAFRNVVFLPRAHSPAGASDGGGRVSASADTYT